MKYKKYLVEESVVTHDVKRVVDNFVRFLIGDRKVAISGFTKLIKTNVPLPNDMSSEEYNTIYKNIFDGMIKTIKKEL